MVDLYLILRHIIDYCCFVCIVSYTVLSAYYTVCSGSVVYFV